MVRVSITGVSGSSPVMVMLLLINRFITPSMVTSVSRTIVAAASGFLFASKIAQLSVPGVLPKPLSVAWVTLKIAITLNSDQ
ncbi:hypothetical protein [Limnospira platensis]|uniref:hypothetical protein n=1 Tax=Limnospira platensis TaxID=118562 RepID=UPI000280452E|nr:hypothetical protein SPLC1_S032640 [Arthrospira platensis C1]